MHKFISLVVFSQQNMKIIDDVKQFYTGNFSSTSFGKKKYLNFLHP